MYTGTRLPKWYIGSTSLKRHLDGYTGSVCSRKWSKIYREELAQNRHLFKTRILSRHRTRSEALREELRVQEMHDVVRNSKYFNESFATIRGFITRDQTGELNNMFGSGHKVKRERNGKARKYYAIGPGNELFDIPRGHLKTFCSEHGMNYDTLRETLRTGKPSQHSKFPANNGFQLFKGTPA